MIKDQARIFRRYVLVTLGLLILAQFLPTTSVEALDPRAAHRVERLPITGTGPLGTVTRLTLTVAGRMAAIALDRQEALLGPTRLAARAGVPLVDLAHRWHTTTLVGLRPTILALVVALAVGIAFYGRRSMVFALLLLVLGCLMVTRPAQVIGATGAPGRAMASGALVILVGPQDQRQLGDEFWSAYVTSNVSRAALGSPVLAEESPAERGGLMAVLTERIGTRTAGIQSVIIGAASVVSVAFFAIFASASAMAAWIAQTLLFLLTAASLVTIPLAFVTDLRRGLVRFWLVPWCMSALVTFATSFTSWAVTALGVALSGAGEWLLSLVSGSTVAFAVVVGSWRFVRRGLRRHLESAPATAQERTEPAEAEGTAA